MQRDRDNDNAHSVCICVYSPCCTLFTYTLQRGNIVSLFIFARRLAMPDFDEWNKSHAFLMPITFVLLTLYNYKTMGILNNFLDKFKNAEFTVAPQKKLKTISADFKKAFDLTLVFYKGVKIADPELTLAALNSKTSKTVNTHADGLKIKASMKVGDAEQLFDTNFGVTVQIKDKEGKKLVPNEITIGQAARGEY